MKTLGEISNGARVTNVTPMQEELARRSKIVRKEEAGLIGDRNIAEISEEDTASLEEELDSDGELIAKVKKRKVLRTQFDDYNERIQELEVLVRQNQVEYKNLFTTSNAQTDAHKRFILENDQEREANIQWCKVAFEKYEGMMSDFQGFKQQTNKEINNLSKQYRDEVLKMRADVDQMMSNSKAMNDKMELQTAAFKDFTNRRDELLGQITSLQQQCILLQDKKLDEKSAIDSFQEVKDSI